MKKKGFTLIELIVVIAIIGVLAAILVPAMLGYVRKSKITTANTTAKDIYNAFNVALVDLDTRDEITSVVGSGATQFNNTNCDTANNTALYKMITTYFSDITSSTISEWAVQVDENGACTGCAVLSGKYGGSYPKQMDVDTWVTGTYTNSLTALLTYALS